MKFQNTLLITTAICFYILLFSQLADSSANRGLANDGVYYHRKRNVDCKIGYDYTNSTDEICIMRGYERDMSHLCKPRDCGRLTLCPGAVDIVCLFTDIGDGEKGYVQPACNSDRSCSNNHHRCVQHNYNDASKFCVEMTDEDWNKLPKCERGLCGSKQICQEDGTNSKYCLK